MMTTIFIRVDMPIEKFIIIRTNYDDVWLNISWNQNFNLLNSLLAIIGLYNHLNGIKSNEILV